MESSEISGPREMVDAVVVGSGFGAAVSAYRLAAGGKSVVVLERGKAYPPGSFPRTPAGMGMNFWDPSRGLYGLFDAWTFRGMEGIVSSGLGGGSLIYANVLLRKDEDWFVQESPLPGGGYEHWPYSRADLDPHYDAVERMLGATRYPYNDTPKTMAMEEGADALGLAHQRPPLAVTFAARPVAAAEPNVELPLPEYGNLHGLRRVTCTLCGECDIGCNVGAKNTLDHTYLSAAAHHGADIRTLHEVRGFRPLPGGGYETRYVVHTPDREAGATSELPVHTIRSRRLILGAGSFGSTYLLLRSRASFPGLGPALGTRFSGNGDLLTLIFNASRGGLAVRPLDGGRGPVITTAIRVGDAVDRNNQGRAGTAGPGGRGFYIEDAGYPGFLNWLAETSQVSSVAKRTAAVAWQLFLDRLFNAQRSNISKDLAAALGQGRISASSLPLLGMGRDYPDGVMTLANGRLAINWTLATSEAYFARMRSTMEQLADQLHADFQDNPLWWSRRVITVHPLGGAPAGRHPGEGVCDGFGEVFGYPGLYVLDGAAMPGPVGANPALTIAAVADRASERMLEQGWDSRRPTDPAAESPAAAPVQLLTGGTSLRFTERMRGYVTNGSTEPLAGAAAARVRGHRLMVELTITAPDVKAFVADPLHRGIAEGFLDSDLLGGRLTVERGWFNLLLRPASSAGRRMLYRLWLQDAGGTPLTLVGFKEIAESNGGPLDVWTDTTTLYVRLLAGHRPPPAADTPEEVAAALEAAGGDLTDGAQVRGAGIIRIHPADFARQLTTFRTRGPDSAGALLGFGRFFLGQLGAVYLTGKRRP